MRLWTATVLVACATSLLAACSGGSPACGAPYDADPSGATMASQGQTFRYGQFTSSPNNDCPATGAKVVSVTLAGSQVEPAGTSSPLTFCLPRPDEISADPIPLTDSERVQIIDVSAKDASGCTYTRDSAAAPTGTLTFAGFCTGAGNTFNLTLDGQIPGTRSCPQSGATSVTLTLSGTVRVQTI